MVGFLIRKNSLLAKSGPRLEPSELLLFCVCRDLVWLEEVEGIEFFLPLKSLELGLEALLEFLLDSGVGA